MPRGPARDSRQGAGMVCMDLGLIAVLLGGYTVIYK